MGVIEAVQHSESSRTITSLNGSHSGEKLGRLPMENGECSFRRELPKLKRRRISAVRDFPPGCGRFPQLNNMRSNEDVASIGTSETIPTESLVKIGDLHEVENFMLSNVQVDDSDSIHEKDVGAVEVIESVTALESVVLSDLPKNLHQVNSFRLVEQASSICPVDRLISRDNGDEQKLMLSTGPVDEANLIKVKAVDTVEIIESVTALEHQITKPLKNLHELSNVRPVEEAVLVGTAEHLIIRGNHDNGPGSGELVSSTGQVDETVMMNAKVVGTVETAESITALEHVISDLMKNPHQLGVATTKEEMVTILPPDESISVSKTTVKKYPPRRTVSAVRDFPLLCGRNASMEARSFGQEKLAIGVEPSSSHTANTSMKQTGEDIQDQEFHKSELGGCVSKVIEDKAQPHCKDHAAIQELERRDRCKVYSKMKVVFEDASESFSELSQESNACQGTGDVGHSQEKMGMEMVVFHENKSPSEEHLDISDYRIQLHEEDFESSELKSDRVTVLGLVAASDSSRRNRKGAGKSKPEGGLSETKRKKSDTKRRSKSASRTKVDSDIGGESPKMIIPLAQKSAYEGTEEYSLEHDQKEDLDVIPQSPPPFGPSSSTSRVHDTDATVTRNKVRETLRLFQVLCRKLLQEEEGKSKEEGVSRKRVDYSAAKILKDKGKYVNTGKQILGAVPGVEVGDEFHYRVELTLVGLHRQVQGGIDYVKHDGRILATSIVASGGYADDLDNSSSLIYTGQGGNVMNTNKEPEDQKLERGNLALKNSMLEKNPVRVIRGSESKDGKSKTYVYDGLYLVEKCWQEIGSHHKLVFKFQLDRIRDQPELAWKEVRKSKKLQVREGRCIADISLGKEPIPICAVNTIDDEKPPSFVYITSMIYPDWCRPIPAKGCRCIVECSDSTKCSCAVDNGGEIPYNFNGAIVEAKPIVYECGPSCKCPPSCHNRVSQQGIKFQLEVFKTESRGWGVRSLNSISSGSFICEYIGELLEDKEAEERADGDEYLFDIGNNYNDNSLWDGLSTLMPDAQPSPFEVVGDGGFTIDAAQYGNVGRFINHSCSPNLYAQNVLFDHDDTRIPHIMLFAAENIPPLQELTYHYNYMIDQVRDSNGNIKRKNCYCGSPDCTGRLY